MNAAPSPQGSPGAPGAPGQEEEPQFELIQQILVELAGSQSDTALEQWVNEPRQKLADHAAQAAGGKQKQQAQAALRGFERAAELIELLRSAKVHHTPPPGPPQPGS